MSACVEKTATEARCRLLGVWLVERPALGREHPLRCYVHAVIAARRQATESRYTSITHQVTGRTVDVGLLPARRRRFKVPTSPAEALRCLPQLRSLTELADVFCAIADNDWVRLGDTRSPLMAALGAARARLRTAASPEELGWYESRGRTSVGVS